MLFFYLKQSAGFRLTDCVCGILRCARDERNGGTEGRETVFYTILLA